MKPIELYSSSWSKENASVMAPNVLELIKNFNRISVWVASEIVSQTNLKKRVLLLKYFISVAIVRIYIFGYFRSMMRIRSLILILHLGHKRISGLRIDVRNHYGTSNDGSF